MTKIKNFKFKVLVCLLILSTFYFLLSTSVSAHTSGLWTPGEPLIPCGGDYTDGNGNVVQRSECTYVIFSFTQAPNRFYSRCRFSNTGNLVFHNRRILYDAWWG